MPSETAPVILTNPPDENYALLDSGDGRKLERYGSFIIDRPESQAIWKQNLPRKRWDAADAVFTGKNDEEGVGRWHFPKEPLGETWPLRWGDIDYLGRFTSFRHVGVFPEQSEHWKFLQESVYSSLKIKPNRQLRILNLFGYTGLASLAAAKAGAHVTHVDASKKAIGWARENQQVANLEAAPVRWICDDAVKFCEREVRRGNVYDGILLDPPKYGRGPKGEVWHLFEGLPNLLKLTRSLLSEDALFVVLTSYSIRTSFFAMHEIMRDTFGDLRGKIESGELVLQTQASDRLLSTSLFSRWVGQADD